MQKVETSFIRFEVFLPPLKGMKGAMSIEGTKEHEDTEAIKTGLVPTTLYCKEVKPVQLQHVEFKYLLTPK